MVLSVRLFAPWRRRRAPWKRRLSRAPWRRRGIQTLKNMCPKTGEPQTRKRKTDAEKDDEASLDEPGKASSSPSRLIL